MRAMKFFRLCLILVLLFSGTTMFAREPMGKSASPVRKPMVDKVKQQKEAKRAALVATIDAQQKIIDRYERQRDSTEKPDPKLVVTEDEYELAKTKRDTAQVELAYLNR